MSKEWDQHKAWFTPGDVGEQGLWAAQRVGVEPDRVIDLGAGAGGIVSRVANVWPGASTTAIEIRGEEEPHLRRWADDVVIRDVRSVVSYHIALSGGRRLFVANPPYGAERGETDLTTQILEWLFEVATVRDWLLLLLRKSYEEAEAAWPFFTDRAPLFDFRIPARANFRRGVSAKGSAYAGDFLGHRWVLWRPGVHPWCWSSAPLPSLPPPSLSWAIRPGTEKERGRLHPALRPSFPRVPAVVTESPEDLRGLGYDEEEHAAWCRRRDAWRKRREVAR